MAGAGGDVVTANGPVASTATPAKATVVDAPPGQGIVGTFRRRRQVLVGSVQGGVDGGIETAPLAPVPDGRGSWGWRRWWGRGQGR